MIIKRQWMALRGQFADKGAETINKASVAVLGEAFAAGAAAPKPKLAHMDTMHDIYFDADGGDDLEAPPVQKDLESPPASPEDIVRPLPSFVVGFRVSILGFTVWFRVEGLGLRVFTYYC
jgi:hypothetical protein